MAKRIQTPPSAPYGLIIPCTLIVLFLFPKPDSVGGWMLYLAFLFAPFSVGAAHAAKQTPDE